MNRCQPPQAVSGDRQGRTPPSPQRLRMEILMHRRAVRAEVAELLANEIFGEPRG